MPHVNIWIRKDDFPRWESIKDKPLFLHNALEVRESYKELPPIERKQIKTQLKKIMEAETLCPHGFPRNGWSSKKGCK